MTCHSQRYLTADYAVATELRRDGIGWDHRPDGSFILPCDGVERPWVFAKLWMKIRRKTK